jgi:hypothetical protein
VFETELRRRTNAWVSAEKFDGLRVFDQGKGVHRLLRTFRNG